MPKDCGCNKKDDKKKDKDDDKKKRNQIWVYKKRCESTLNIPDNSYLGKIGFAYSLINKDTKASLEYKVDYKFSNLTPDEIVYYVFLYKVTKTKFVKKTNTIKKYLECVSQYSYTSKIEQYTMNDIINKIGNDNYDLIPDDSNKFNEIVIKYILKSYKKSLDKSTVTPSMSVKITQVNKSYSLQGCNGVCTNIKNCGAGGCQVCVTPYGQAPVGGIEGKCIYAYQL